MAETKEQLKTSALNESAAAMNDATSSTAVREVKFLFKATKAGFGPYAIADPDVKTLVGRAARYGRYKLDPTHERLSLDNFVTDLDRFPSQLEGVVSQTEYSQKMAELKDELSNHRGPTYPMLAFVVFLVTGVGVDVIWNVLGFFALILPVLAFFATYALVQSKYKANIEDIFASWSNIIRATFYTNVVKGNVAILELRVKSPQAE